MTHNQRNHSYNGITYRRQTLYVRYGQLLYSKLLISLVFTKKTAVLLERGSPFNHGGSKRNQFKDPHKANKRYDWNAKSCKMGPALQNCTVVNNKVIPLPLQQPAFSIPFCLSGNIYSNLFSAFFLSLLGCSIPFSLSIIFD